MVSVSLLRIGPTLENTSATLVRDALANSFESESSTDAIVVANKYFDARVRIEELGSGIQGKEDGIILVFNAASSNPCCSFDSLHEIHEQAQQRDQCGELLRLCVGVVVGKSEAQELRGEKHEKEFSRRVLWCLDRGYEYVEADLSLEGQKAGHDEREKEGFARIVEAITSTMWSSAVIKSTKKTDLLRSYKEGSQAHGKPLDSLSKSEHVEDEVAAKSIADDISKNLEDQNRVEKAENGTNNDPKLFETGYIEQEEEDAFGNLERAIGEAKRIREASKSGTLSDDDRRKRAGDAAILMMDLMGQLNIGEESSSSASDDGSKGSSIAEDENNESKSMETTGRN